MLTYDMVYLLFEAHICEKMSSITKSMLILVVVFYRNTCEIDVYTYH